MNNLFVTLGAYGDCVNTLPLVFQDFQQGNKPTFLIARQFDGLLDGVSYCDRMVWDGHYSECLKATEWAQAQESFDTVSICQCYGTSIERHTQSYAQEAWRLVGKLNLWDKLPLVFDQRNTIREAELLLKVGGGDKPMALVSTTGKSSPFPYRQQLFDLLEPLKDKFNIVSMDDIKADRFFDLIALYERAYCLITIDSGPLHLAQAVPELNVIALVTHSPDLWHGSPRRSNHKLFLRYNEFERRKGEIVQHLTLPNKMVYREGDFLVKWNWIQGENPARKLVHVYGEYERHNAGAIRRNGVARQTWNAEYKQGNWLPCPVHENALPRNANSVGEQKPVPFVRDLFLEAVNRAGQDDIIVFSNDDTCFTPGLTKVILDKVTQHRAMWGARREHKSVTTPMALDRIVQGYGHCGADIFAFSRAWWDKHGDDFPDFVLSFELWDLVLKKLITMTGGIEVANTCYHEIHESFWHNPANREGAGNLYNRELGRQWLAKHQIQWAEAFK